MGIDMVQLVPVEARGPLIDIGNIEPSDGLFVGEDLIIAMAPA